MTDKKETLGINRWISKDTLKVIPLVRAAGRRKDLPPYQKDLLIELITWWGTLGRCWPKLKDIAKETGWEYDTVKKGFRGLLDKGEIITWLDENKLRYTCPHPQIMIQGYQDGIKMPVAMEQAAKNYIEKYGSEFKPHVTSKRVRKKGPQSPKKRDHSPLNSNQNNEKKGLPSPKKGLQSPRNYENQGQDLSVPAYKYSIRIASTENTEKDNTENTDYRSSCSDCVSQEDLRVQLSPPTSEMSNPTETLEQVNATSRQASGSPKPAKSRSANGEEGKPMQSTTSGSVTREMVAQTLTEYNFDGVTERNTSVRIIVERMNLDNRYRPWLIGRIHEFKAKNGTLDPLQLARFVDTCKASETTPACVDTLEKSPTVRVNEAAS